MAARRHEIFPHYKAQRRPMPEEIKEATPRIQELLSAMLVPLLSVPGVEADDVIGSISTRARAEGFAVAIASPDKVACGQKNEILICHMDQMCTRLSLVETSVAV